MTPKSFVQFQYKIEEQCHSFMTKLDKFSWCFPVTQNISYFRSPSPEPIYSSDGKRLNTREYRKRKEFEEMRHDAIQKMMLVNTDYKPPPDYKWAWVYLFKFSHNLSQGTSDQSERQSHDTPGQPSWYQLCRTSNWTERKYPEEYGERHRSKDHYQRER